VTRLEEVERRAAELGFAPLLGRIRRSLRAAGQRRSADRSVTPGGLTGREREVLALVAEGLTNPEIAARLGLAPRTVATQIASASAKLGATNRAQAASLALASSSRV
jgi:DNA-binding NarL/FixJ family response regulator